MSVYTKSGRRIAFESAHIDEDCYIADKLVKIRVGPKGRKTERVYWVWELLADGGKTEIQDFIAALKRHWLNECQFVPRHRQELSLPGMSKQRALGSRLKQLGPLSVFL